MKRLTVFFLIMALLCGCAQRAVTETSGELYQSRFETESVITLSDEKINLDGNEVGNSGDVYISRDIIYYEDRDTYESGNSYGEGEKADKHSPEEAMEHRVINITKSGAYRIKGKLSKGQIRIDLGEEARNNPEAVVELILDNADITSTVAPAILFMNVYECDGNWTVDTAKADVDTKNAGAVLILEDNSENNIKGSYVAKIFKDNGEEKKLYKQDGAIYSYMSMNVEGGGTLNLEAENEGLDTELHLTINGGNINIYSENDGINTNEDNVSVTTINGGNINIVAGLGAEGDGIDSNGWLVINGGTVIASANPKADAGLDSDLGSYINGGTVIALGSTMDWAESDSEQVTMNLQFSQSVKNDSPIVVYDKDGKIVFAYKLSENEKTPSRNFRGAVISDSELKVGEEYTLYIGGTISGENENGVYKKVGEYKDGIKQGYYGTDSGIGGGFGKGMRPGNPPNMPEGEIGKMPDGEKPFGERPDMPKGERPVMPEGERAFEKREGMPRGEDGGMPDGEMPPMPDFGRGPMSMDKNFENGEHKTEFVMTDKVNLFTLVSDLKEQ